MQGKPKFISDKIQMMAEYTDKETGKTKTHSQVISSTLTEKQFLATVLSPILQQSREHSPIKLEFTRLYPHPDNDTRGKAKLEIPEAWQAKSLHQQKEVENLRQAIKVLLYSLKNRIQKETPYLWNH